MPKLLWVSPLSIHDSASTSATQMRNMLLSLKARNVDIVGLSSLCFVHESGTTMFNNLEENLTKSKENSFNLTDNNINFIYVRTKSRRLGDMVSQEQRAFYAKFCGLINAFRPDVVMGSGTDMLSMVCFDEARRRGIPTVYTLLDGTPRRFNFPNIDVVVTDSNAISSLYANQYRINAIVTGSFLPVIAPTKEEKNQEITTAELNSPKAKKHQDGRFRITMLNPAVEKGVGIFTQLAQSAVSNFKNYQFTVYEASPGQFAQNIATVREPGLAAPAFNKSDLSRIEVFSAPIPSKEVMAQTKVLVVPSLNFEGIVNIAREAISQGIPVLATNQTGIAESIGEAGVLVEPPSYCVADPRVLPNADDSAVFLKGLTILLSEDFSERCARVAKSYDVNVSANRLATILKPLFDRRAGNNPQILRNGSLI